MFCYPVQAQGQLNPLKDKIICIDPGHGGTAETDSYRVGPAGEREEWINLRVGMALKQLLEKKGAEVVMTREKDKDVSLSDRARIAEEHNADVFVSIHHNATADSTVNFPIVYFHGQASENKAGVRLGQLLIDHLAKELYDNQTPASLVSDHVIFPGSGTAVLRETYGIPGVLAEASFFTHPEEEKRLKDIKYNRREARAYLEALQKFFSKENPPIYEVNSKSDIAPFQVLQEEERMKPVAKRWKSNFTKGYQLFQKEDSLALQKALDFFTLSARSFPDSWLSGRAHSYRAKIFKRIGRENSQNEAKMRVAAHYVPLQRNNEYLRRLYKKSNEGLD